ncbi:hypothetical protein Vi05172_g4804 [Venturia inaequalis]|nr:hypothetical protein Vi05172_g4804 [Venturia inaequalis]
MDRTKPPPPSPTRTPPPPVSPTYSPLSHTHTPTPPTRRSRTRSPRSGVQDSPSGTTGRRSPRISKPPRRRTSQSRASSTGSRNLSNDGTNANDNVDTDVEDEGLWFTSPGGTRLRRLADRTVYAEDYPVYEGATEMERLPEPDSDMERGSSLYDSDPPHEDMDMSDHHSSRLKYKNDPNSGRCENLIPKPPYRNNPWFRRPAPGRTAPGIVQPAPGIQPLTFELDRWTPLPVIDPLELPVTRCTNVGTVARPLLPCLATQIFSAEPFNRARMPDRYRKLKDGNLKDAQECRQLICLDCSTRNRRNFNIIKEAANLGVCKECYKREKNPKNRNNTQPSATHGTPSWDCVCLPYPNDTDGGVCATHLETYADLVRQRALRSVFYRRQIKHHKPVARAKRWTTTKGSKTGKMRHAGVYWRHPRGELYAEPHCICGRPARHKRIGWQDEPHYDARNKGLNGDLVRSCAVCTPVPGDVEAGNPRPMMVETDEDGSHIGPGVLTRPKLVPAGLNLGRDFGTEGWVRRDVVVAPSVIAGSGVAVAAPAPPPPRPGPGTGTVTGVPSPFYRLLDAKRRRQGHLIIPSADDLYTPLTETRNEQYNRLAAYTTLTRGFPTANEEQHLINLAQQRMGAALVARQAARYALDSAGIALWDVEEGDGVVGVGVLEGMGMREDAVEGFWEAVGVLGGADEEVDVARGVLGRERFVRHWYGVDGLEDGFWRTG